MTSKNEYTNLESIKDTDICKATSPGELFKWDSANDLEKKLYKQLHKKDRVWT